MTYKSIFIFSILMGTQTIVGFPFESVSVTNGLSYCRTREFHHGGFVYPNSRLGMNKFIERSSSNEELEEALYGCVRFLKYVYPRIEDERLEHWSRRNGFLGMNTPTSFPAYSQKRTTFGGHDIYEVRVVQFPFEVKNTLSQETLKVILVKMYFKESFLGALYYNCNTSDVDFSFTDVSGNKELVGQESNAPYLSYDEKLIQKKLCDDMLRRIVGRGIPSSSSQNYEQAPSTNQVKEIEVIGLEI